MATNLLIWGILLHLLVDWFFQNEWIAINKVNWKHPAGYIHAASHGLIQLLIFPWWAALAIGLLHFLIDLRKPLIWWRTFIGQTQARDWEENALPIEQKLSAQKSIASMKLHPKIMDLGMDVAVWQDQVAHFLVIGAMALVVA